MDQIVQNRADRPMPTLVFFYGTRLETLLAAGTLDPEPGLTPFFSGRLRFSPAGGDYEGGPEKNVVSK
jgi:hypothetical protein